jgi:hypothetical protein
VSHRATNNNRCKLCQSRPLKFSNSHIIPRSFFHLFRGDEPNSVALDVGGKTNKVQKKQAGFSEPAMLCESCEKKFSNFDSYGWKILGSKNLTARVSLFLLRVAKDPVSRILAGFEMLSDHPPTGESLPQSYPPINRPFGICDLVGFNRLWKASDCRSRSGSAGFPRRFRFHAKI